MSNTYEILTPSPIVNAIVKKVYSAGVFSCYTIEPCDGFALHDASRDCIDVSMESGESTLLLGYTMVLATCGANYDFELNTRQFYAVPKDEAYKNHAAIDNDYK